MNEESDKQAEEQVEDERPRCGERLAAAREELEISVAEIAKELHLDEQKVIALERSDFAPLGAAVFAKGHLRKYAQLVGVDQDDVLTAYHQLTRSEGLPPVISNRKAPKLPASPTPWIAGALIILLAAAAAGAWYFLFRDAPDDAIDAPVGAAAEVEEITESVTSLAEQLGDESPEPPADEDVFQETAVFAPDTAESAAAETPPSTPPNDPEPLPATDDLKLSLRFSGECWTEITDGNGRRLFFDLGRAGRTVDLSGEPPFSILFGNAANVSLRVNGSAYTIPDAGRRGETARFTLYAP